MSPDRPIESLSSPTLADLAARWLALLDRLGVEPAAAQGCFAALIAAYSAPTRYYHNLAHIRHVLITLDFLQDQAVDRSALQLAAWFHDLVYDPRATNNEEQSAITAQRLLAELHIPETTLRRIVALIRATQHHVAPAGDSDAALLLDADLAILGSPWVQYGRYARAIRQEYAWVPDVDYRGARTQVLHGLLQRERIYLTDRLFRTYERPARRNLAKEIAALR